MEAFQIGPFDYTPGKSRTLNGVAQTEWALCYGDKLVGSAWVAGDRAQVVEALAVQRGDFVARLRTDNAPDCLILRRWDDAAPLDSTLLESWPDDLAGSVADDSSEFWAEVQGSKRRMPVTLELWARLRDRHSAPPLAWIAGLLPADVLARELADWRAPTSWELRHVVGEGSFTGRSGAQTAAMVGVTPQNFRKYTARDGASTRQGMSFAMWHLLLHKLGVQRV